MAALYLVRHAQAEVGGGRDHDRPLDADGRAAARRLGRALAARAPAPALALCSSARRARETWAEIADEWRPAPALSVEEALYLASADGLLERLGRLPADCEGAALIGHNPGLGQLALSLVEAGGPPRLRAGLPPGAAVALECGPGGWAALGAGACRLVALLLPERLA